MLITIGIPTYNRPKELSRVLDAVLCQTYTNIEIIVSNNKSSDPEVKFVAEKYASADPRIKYYHQNKPIPVMDHFKFVSEQATGEYFMFLADDDWIDPNYIEECFNFLSKNSDYSLVCGKCAYHRQDGTLIEDIPMANCESDRAVARLLVFYRNVKLNGYYYGLRRTNVGKKIPMQNIIATDWVYVAALIFRGKVRVMDSTYMHITAGGMSNSVGEMNRNLGSNNFFTKNFAGFISAKNAAVSVFAPGMYLLNFFSKITLAIRIFAILYSKTFFWDAVHIKRLLFGKPKSAKI